MTRTFILRCTAAATLLAGAVALGTVMFGQAGRTAPPSVKLTRDTANTQDQGVPTVAYSGSTNFAQGVSSDADISRPGAPTRQFIGTAEPRSGNSRQSSVLDADAVGSTTDLRASGDPANGIGFAAQSTATSGMTSGTASAVGSGALPPTGADFAQRGTWGWATSGFFRAGGVGPYPASAPASSRPAISTPAIAAAPAVVAAVGPTAPVSAGSLSPSKDAVPAIIAAPIPPIVIAKNFVQTEGKTVVNNVLVTDSVNILGGRLGGSGTIQSASITIGAGATLGPGNSPGTLTIDGNLVQRGVLEIEIESLSKFDFLNVHGTVTFEPGSEVKFVLYDTYTPSNGDDFEFLTANAILGIENLAYAIAGLLADFGYQVYTETADGSTDMYVRFYSRAQGAAVPDADQSIVYQGHVVPEPSSMALSALGLALLGWRMRRRIAVLQVR